MRLLAFLSLGLLWFAAPAAGQFASEPPPAVRHAFEEGNRRYTAGDYEEALREYEHALASEWASGALYYNAAGAHYRLGHLGAAVQHYEKARALLPARERLRHNLSVTRSRLDAPPPARRSFFTRARSRAASRVPPALLFALGGTLFAVGLGWWVYRQSAPGARFWPHGAAAALLGTGLALAALGLVLSAPVGEGRTVALRGPLALLAEPAAETDSTGAVPEGTVLRITGREAVWTRVRSSRGDEGWVPTDALGDI